MSGRIVDLSERSRRNGKATNGAGTDPNPQGVARRIPRALIPIHEWDVDIVAMLRIEHGVVPATANVRWTISIDTLRRSYCIAVYRESWQHNLVLQVGFRPDETPEQAARREGIIVFLNELLSASYGVPACGEPTRPRVFTAE